MTTPIDILLVDDEERNLDALEAILAQPEYRLLRAQNADTALRLLLDHDVAAIVLDIQMPQVSGFELATMIKTTKRFRETPIVFLTAFMMDDQHVVQGYGAGAVDYLTKPFNPQILRQKIAVFAELFRKTRALAELNETLEVRVKERTAELEKSESALRASGQQKDEFLAVLAHELRNPLAPLRMGLDLLLNQPEKAPLVQRTLMVMNRQLDHMVRLIDDLLDISRLSRGSLELKKAQMDLKSVVLATTESFKPILERRKQTLLVDCPASVTLDCDSTRIAQIVGNLLHNATKFTPEGGTISVDMHLVPPFAIVNVKDSGIGLAPGEESQVFEMFARLGRMEVPGQPGLGIGLALARRLAEMHGGTLQATSAGHDQGSTFTLTLPLADATPLGDWEGGESSPQAVPTIVRKILVIEDNEDVAATLSDWLEERGHKVWHARNGKEGVRLAEDLRPEVVLCDLGLPEMDGLAVCQQIRMSGLERQPFMVALTGWGREDDRGRTKAAGFDHHLVKPVAARELHKVLQHAMKDAGVMGGAE